MYVGIETLSINNLTPITYNQCPAATQQFPQTLHTDRAGLFFGHGLQGIVMKQVMDNVSAVLHAGGGRGVVFIRIIIFIAIIMI